MLKETESWPQKPIPGGGGEKHKGSQEPELGSGVWASEGRERGGKQLPWRARQDAET